MVTDQRFPAGAGHPLVRCTVLAADARRTSRRAGPVLTRILPTDFRAKASAEGPRGNRALQDGVPPIVDLPPLDLDQD